jgi:hypothetical protein
MTRNPIRPMARIVNPVAYDELESAIRLGLVRYLGKLTKRTGERWKIDHIYKPTAWYRARLSSQQGSVLIIWYRPKNRSWTVIDQYSGLGVRPRRRSRQRLWAEKRKAILEARRGRTQTDPAE